MSKRHRHCILLALLVLGPTAPLTWADFGSAFTYQGNLVDGTTPASGPHAMVFSLWNDPTDGTQVGPTLSFTGTGGNPSPIQVNDGVFTVTLDFGAAAFNGEARWLQIRVNGVPLTPRHRIAPAPYALQTRGIYVDPANRVGIATTIPRQTVSIGDYLDLYSGAINSPTRPSIRGSSANNLVLSAADTGAVFINNDGGTGGIRVHNGSPGAGNEVMRITAGGAVGIGTATPGFPLTFSNTLGSKISLWGQSGAHYGFGIQSFQFQFIAASAADDFVFGHGASDSLTEYMRLRNGGNLGIGTPSPTARLHVSGGPPFNHAVIDSTNTLGTWLNVRNLGTDGRDWAVVSTGVGNTEGAGAFLVRDNTASAVRIAVLPGGNVGVGTITPSERLHVVGNICATGTIGACSDARFKHRVEPLHNPLDLVERLRGVTFDWNRAAHPSHEFSAERQLGFIAQEVEAVLPHVVSRGSDGALSVDYGRLTPVLVEAIKALRSDNQQLRDQHEAAILSIRAERDAELAALRGRLARLEALLDDRKTP